MKIQNIVEFLFVIKSSFTFSITFKRLVKIFRLEFCIFWAFKPQHIDNDHRSKTAECPRTSFGSLSSKCIPKESVHIKQLNNLIIVSRPNNNKLQIPKLLNKCNRYYYIPLGTLSSINLSIWILCLYNIDFTQD